MSPTTTGGVMKYNPAKHHRHSTRKRGYDYSSSGAYFITAVVQDRLCLFGTVKRDGVHLSDIGEIARECWVDLPFHFPYVELDEFVFMPDHMHGIIFILADDATRYVSNFAATRGVQLNAPLQAPLNAPLQAPLNAPLQAPLNAPLNAPLQAPLNAPLNAPLHSPSRIEDNYHSIISPKKGSISVIVRTFKAAVTTLCRENGIYHFKWQRNYHDHIIRNERELIAIRKYIVENPRKWWFEKEHPSRD